MDVILDEVGYPLSLGNRLVSKIKTALDSDNFYTIKEEISKLNIIFDYWSELKPYYEQRQYGEITDDEYKTIMNKMQVKYFKEKASIQSIHYINT